jgi:hypothetical protein
MFGDNWKARIDSALSGIGRDMKDMARQGWQFLESLETTEQLVLLGLVMIGLFYLLMGHFKGGNEEEKAGGRFMGIMFMTVAAAATLGWVASGYTT